MIGEEVFDHRFLRWAQMWSGVWFHHLWFIIGSLAKKAKEPEGDALGAALLDVVDREVGVVEVFDLGAVFAGAADFEGVASVEEEVALGGGANGQVGR